MKCFRRQKAPQISGLVFFRILHAGEGRRIEGQVLLNPYTKNSLSSRAIILLQEMFSGPGRENNERMLSPYQ